MTEKDDLTKAGSDNDISIEKSVGGNAGPFGEKPLKPQNTSENIEPNETPTSPVFRNTLFPLFAGGILAGAIGFGVAIFMPSYGSYFKTDSTEIDELKSQMTVVDSEIAAIQSELVQLKETLAGVATTGAVDSLVLRQDGVDQDARKQAEITELLSNRLTDIENRPIPEIGATAEAVATYERELIAMREMFSKELVRIENAQVESTQAQVNAAIQTDTVAKKAALSTIQKAVETGEKFENPLTELGNSGVEIPDGLTRVASNGAVTLSQLQEGFPGAARKALDAAIRAEADAGTTNKISAFFRTQLGARSLSPQEGDGPDAVLSRAEAALRKADISGAIAELRTLSDAGTRAMTDWIDLAKSRQSVVDALAELTTNLGN